MPRHLGRAMRAQAPDRLAEPNSRCQPVFCTLWKVLSIRSCRQWSHRSKPVRRAVRWWVREGWGCPGPGCPDTPVARRPRGSPCRRGCRPATPSPTPAPPQPAHLSRQAPFVGSGHARRGADQDPLVSARLQVATDAHTIVGCGPVAPAADDRARLGVQQQVKGRAGGHQDAIQGILARPQPCPGQQELLGSHRR